MPWREPGRDETHRPRERDVEITDVKTMAIAGNFAWGIVAVETDAGVTGFGETFRAEAALDMAERLAVDLVGENPLETDRLVELLNQRYTGCGRIERSIRVLSAREEEPTTPLQDVTSNVASRISLSW